MNPHGEPAYQPHPPTSHRRPRHWPWIAGIAAAFAAGTVISATNPPATPAPAATITVTAEAPAPAAAPAPATTRTVTVTRTVTPAPLATVPGEGTYLVGVDMAPGVWRAAATTADSCYWARLSSTDTGDIIDNNNTSGPVVLTIRKTDVAFETSGCAEWRRVS